MYWKNMEEWYEKYHSSKGANMLVQMPSASRTNWNWDGVYPQAESFSQRWLHPGDYSQNRRVCKNVISMLPLRKVSSVYIYCRMGLRKMVILELDIRFFQTFFKGITIKSIGFDMLFRVNARKVHKIIGTKSNFNKSGTVIAIPVNKCKLFVAEISIIWCGAFADNGYCFFFSHRITPVFPLKQRQQIHTELLKAGIELICEKGVRKWTIDEVTQRVQIGKGTFYHFFASKELFAFYISNSTSTI